MSSIPLVAALILGAAAVPMAQSQASPLSVTDLVAACPALGPGTLQKNTAVEPMIAAGPRDPDGRQRLVAVWQQDRWDPRGAQGIESAISDDGGTSWSSPVLPFGGCTTGHLGYERITDPWVSIGPDATVYVTAIGFTDTPGPSPNSYFVRSAVLAVTSTDGGRTWSTPVVLATEGDKEAVTADPHRPGWAYTVWQWSTGSWFAATHDHGVTWSAPRLIVPHREGGTNGNLILVDARPNVLYDVFDQVQSLDDLRGTVSVAISKDGGGTWSPPRAVGTDHSVLNQSPCIDTLRAGHNIPSAAIDPSSGRLYIAWQDTQPSRYAWTVSLVSLDPGLRRHKHITLRNTRTCMPFTPAVAVSGRTIGLTYYSVDDSAASDAPIPGHLWFTAVDAKTMRASAPHQLLAPFDLRQAPKNHFLGDYQGLVPIAGGFEAVAAAPTAAGETDVLAIRITTPRR